MRALDAGFDAYQPSAHPNQKPVELMKWCLSCAKDAKLLCDPYCGSGSTLVAAKEEGIVRDRNRSVMRVKHS